MLYLFLWKLTVRFHLELHTQQALQTRYNPFQKEKCAILKQALITLHQKCFPISNLHTSLAELHNEWKDKKYLAAFFSYIK